MTDLRLVAELAYAVDTRTSFAFSLVAARTPFQVVTNEVIDVGPNTDWSLVPYGEGTHQILRLTVDPGDLYLSYAASVSVGGRSTGHRPGDVRPDDQHPDLYEVPFDEIPAEVLPYLTASRYCESDKLADFAWRHFGHMQPGYGRVQAISDWVNRSFVYQPGSTDASSSATDVLLQRAGVCRDYAHVAIAICRALGIPARYVSGYGLGVEPQDFHGFFEAYVGGDWYLFDPTGMAVPNGLVRIGYGRDAADVPFATLVGRAMMTNKFISVVVDGA
jgi:transglutaminase-like putative cysteine protease